MVRVAERTRMKGQRTLRTRSECDTGVRGTPGRIAARKKKREERRRGRLQSMLDASFFYQRQER